MYRYSRCRILLKVLVGRGLDSLIDAEQIYSDLPVIVSLEVHCSKEQQEIMVEIINELWAPYLVRAKSEELDHLPSPKDMKGKILIKVKYVPPEAMKKKVAKSSAQSVLGRNRTVSSSSSSSENQDVTVGEEQKKKKSAITEALSALGIYTRSYHFKSLGAPESSIPTHVFSLSENKFEEVYEKEAGSLLNHNRHFLMRAFPSGMRVASSNLNPLKFWLKGVQIVALNWQKYDKGMMLNHAMFADSDGWVLKPEGCRGNLAEDGNSQGEVSKVVRLTISVTIFAAQAIPLPTGDSKPSGFHPYIKCELHVDKAQENHTVEQDPNPKKGANRKSDSRYKHRTTTQKGCNPDFKTEHMVFPATNVVESLSFLRWVSFLIRS